MDEIDPQRERVRDLPEFEQDDERTVGGGLMAEGGTSTDRGTGELDGVAQGDASEDEDETTEGLADDAAPGGRMIPGPPAGGAAPYLGAYVDADDETGNDGGRGEQG
jgi:hypothetical protein